jgi:cysteine synthase A
MVGNTPLMRIKSLSDALGVEILGKTEVSLKNAFMLIYLNAQFLNPGGSVKDRVALQSYLFHFGNYSVLTGLCSDR